MDRQLPHPHRTPLSASGGVQAAAGGHVVEDASQMKFIKDYRTIITANLIFKGAESQLYNETLRIYEVCMHIKQQKNGLFALL